MITIDFKRLGIKPGYRILDMGCGEGRHTAAAYMLEKTVVTGADLSFEDLRKTESKLRFHDTIGEHGGGSWNLSSADITCLPFKDNWFDLVICSEVLEHIPNHRAAAREITRVLKPGKNLVVSVPRYWPERLCWALSREYAQTPGGHIRIYQKDKLVRMLEETGTRYTGFHHAHSLHAPFWWMKCLAGLENKDSLPVNLYHKLLVWDLMKKPRVTATVEKLLNPLLGKSLVVYMQKK